MANKNDVALALLLLGHKAKDKVTGVDGIVTTVTFDLYGCIQVLLHLGVDKELKVRDQIWLDVNRLETISLDAERVMPVPEKFVLIDDMAHLRVDHDAGPAEKPPMGKF